MFKNPVKHKLWIGWIIGLFAAGWTFGFFAYSMKLVNDSGAGEYFVYPGMIASALVAFLYIVVMLLTRIIPFIRRKQKEDLENEIIRAKKLLEDGLITEKKYTELIAVYKKSYSS